MSNILIIKHGSLGDIAQASGAIQDIYENYKNDKNLSPSLQIHSGLLLSEEVGDSLSLSVSKLV